jgi:pimeloyl-ACP methyl ester carboxylesterase
MTTGNAGRVCFYADPGADPGARPLLLLHSINAAPSAMEIKPLFDHYRGQRPVYAPDLPGFGLSERADIDYSPALYADTLLAIIDTITTRPVDVVALSTTAEFVARAALTAPERFASLTLISPTGLGNRTPISPQTSARLHRFFRLPGLGGGLYRLLTTRLSIRYFLAMAFTGDTPADLIDYACKTTRQPGARYAPYCFLSGKLFTAGAHKHLYAKLEVKTLILYDQDPNVSFDRLPALLEHNAQISAVRIAPTLGLPHWQMPAETTAALDAFWKPTSAPET